MNRQTAIANDNRIYDLASYTVSDGMTRRVKDISKIEDKFMEFKRLVMRGEFPSIESLEEDICTRYGVMEKVKETPMEALEEIDAEFKRRDLNGK